MPIISGFYADGLFVICPLLFLFKFFVCNTLPNKFNENEESKNLRADLDMIRER